MKYLVVVFSSLAIGTAPAALAQNSLSFEVHANVFDPSHTNLVQSTWVSGLGCPTNAGTSATGGHQQDGPVFTDPACVTGDSKDGHNQGLLLVKTGPTGNFAAATATVTGLPKHTVLSELGYDLRKPSNANDARGSHCGAGAPRFNVATEDGNFYFIGCNSPAAAQTAGSGSWIRLRWGTGTAGSVMGFNANTGILQAITSPVVSIGIVFDEGSDTGPDNFGAAVLDNIDINAVLVGQGPGGAGN